MGVITLLEVPLYSATTARSACLAKQEVSRRRRLYLFALPRHHHRKASNDGRLINCGYVRLLYHVVTDSEVSKFV